MDPPRRTYQTLLPAPSSSGVGTTSSLTEYDDIKASTHSYGGGSSGADDVGVSDFVKKLYHMLQDTSLYDIVSWGPKGDCFIVKNMHEFTNTVLPQTYKHQNFASFVRQLNKYDFHKIKTSDDLEYGEQSCTFRHPDFRADRPEALDAIKRKAPMARRSSALPVQPRPSAPQSSQVPSQTSDVTALRSQIESLHHTQDDMSIHVRNLERSYHDLLVELVGFQRNMVKQDSLMQDLIQYFLQSSRAQMSIPAPTPSSAVSRPSMPEQSQFVPQQDIRHLMTPDAANTSLRQMNDLSFLSNTRSGWSAGTNNTMVEGMSNMPTYGSSSSLDNSIQGGNQSRTDLLQRIQELQQMRTGMAATVSLNLPPTPLSLAGQDNNDADDNEMVMPTVSNPNLAPSVPPSLSNLPTLTPPANSTIVPPSNTASGLFSWPEEGVYDGLQVYTVGHLMPKETTSSGGWHGQAWDSPSESSGSTDFSNAASPATSTTSQKLRVRRSTYVPGWSVPPRVLLVDDDAVSRKLSSKFLQVFGCTIDVAMDGASAVNKMNLEKYDLVLMDIVMPKLDGMAATSLIRQFDHTTPIISMTSNSKPTEIMAYYSSGMNDILPKPFNKEGLLSMLEKHLSGLRELGKTNASIPRQPGAAGSDSNNTSTQDEMVSFGVAEDAGRVNPLADMGLSDEQYNELLQSIIQQDSLGTPSEKRSLDDDGNQSAHKRARFGV